MAEQPPSDERAMPSDSSRRAKPSRLGAVKGSVQQPEPVKAPIATAVVSPKTIEKGAGEEKRQALSPAPPSPRPTNYRPEKTKPADDQSGLHDRLGMANIRTATSSASSRSATTRFIL